MARKKCLLRHPLDQSVLVSPLMSSAPAPPVAVADGKTYSDRIPYLVWISRMRTADVAVETHFLTGS